MNDHYLPKNQRKNKPSKKDNKNEQKQSKIDNNSRLNGMKTSMWDRSMLAFCKASNYM